MQQLKKNLSSYPVFIMWEQLNINGFYEANNGRFGLDEMWESACTHYEDFKKSNYDNPHESEYDCIMDYVKSII
jgi:hypothetical protein